MPRQLDRVNSLTVHSQVVLTTERPATPLTAVWLVSAVNQHVVLQTLRRQLDMADLTLAALSHHRLGHVLSALMLDQCTLSEKPASAREALVWPLAGMQHQVISQHCSHQELLATHRTLVLVHVRVTVFQLHVYVEVLVRLTTLGAHLRPHSGVP